MISNPIVTILSAAFVLVLLITPMIAHGTFVREAPASVIRVMPITFSNSNGDKLDSVLVGQQVMITTTFVNQRQVPQAFVSIYEVRTLNGTSIYLAWQSAEIAPFANSTVGVSWQIETPADLYTARAYAISDFEEPAILSKVSQVEITVK